MLSDHGDTVEDDVVVDESSEEATGTMPLLLLVPGSKRQGLQKRTEMHRGRFSKHCNDNDCRDTAKSLLSLIFGMSSLIFCSKRIPGHGTHRSLYPMQKDALL